MSADADMNVAPIRLHRFYRRRDGQMHRQGKRPRRGKETRSFIDVRRACHDWLMRKDPVYREDHLQRMEGTPPSEAEADARKQAAAEGYEDAADGDGLSEAKAT